MLSSGVFSGIIDQVRIQFDLGDNADEILPGASDMFGSTQYILNLSQARVESLPVTPEEPIDIITDTSFTLSSVQQIPSADNSSLSLVTATCQGILQLSPEINEANSSFSIYANFEGNFQLIQEISQGQEEVKTSFDDYYRIIDLPNVHVHGFGNAANSTGGTDSQEFDLSLEELSIFNIVDEREPVILGSISDNLYRSSSVNKLFFKKA